MNNEWDELDTIMDEAVPVLLLLAGTFLLFLLVVSLG